MEQLHQQLLKCQAEMEEIRHQLGTLKELHTKDVHSLRRFLQGVAHGQPKKDAAGRSRQKALAAAAREQGKILTSCTDGEWRPKPIGYIESVFKHKNGTPRQANVCETSRAVLTIAADLFSNPDHSLENLEAFSHLWVIYQFHKNNNSYMKAKVAPPRLDGRRVGLFSTRSPYRPNAIGLSLVTIEKVSGSSVHLSGVDMLDGTPVLDIKPYIPDYDMPRKVLHAADPANRSPDKKVEASHADAADVDQFHLGENDEYKKMLDTEDIETFVHKMDEIRETENDKVVENVEGTPIYPLANEVISLNKQSSDPSSLDFDTVGKNKMTGPMDTNSSMSGSNSPSSDSLSNAIRIPGKPQVSQTTQNPMDGTTDDVKFAKWVETPPISNLDVLFTNRAESTLNDVASELAKSSDTSSVTFQSKADLRQAIVSILNADPRSTYRRQRCVDRLYYFIVARVHVTCWFDGNSAEVLRLDLLKQ